MESLENHEHPNNISTNGASKEAEKPDNPEREPDVEEVWFAVGLLLLFSA